MDWIYCACASALRSVLFLPYLVELARSQFLTNQNREPLAMYQSNSSVRSIKAVHAQVLVIVLASYLVMRVFLVLQLLTVSSCLGLSTLLLDSVLPVCLPLSLPVLPPVCESVTVRVGVVPIRPPVSVCDPLLEIPLSLFFGVLPSVCEPVVFLPVRPPVCDSVGLVSVRPPLCDCEPVGFFLPVGVRPPVCDSVDLVPVRPLYTCPMISHSTTCLAFCRVCAELGMEDCIIISSDSDDEVKSDSPVFVFTPTKRPPSPDLADKDR